MLSVQRFFSLLRSLFSWKNSSRAAARVKKRLHGKREKTGDMCLGFFTLRGRKFPHGNFRTTRVLRSQNTDCRKNDSFSTVSNRGQTPRFFLWQRKGSETDRKTRLRDTSQNKLHGEGKLHPSLRYGQMSLCRKHKNERIDFLIIGRLSEIVENSKKNVPVSRESSIINTIIRRDG